MALKFEHAIFKYFMALVILTGTLFSCSKEDDSDSSSNYGCEDVDLGEFYLSDVSKNKIFYTENSILVFEDTMGKIRTFRLDTAVSKNIMQPITTTTPCEIEGAPDRRNTYLAETFFFTFNDDFPSDSARTLSLSLRTHLSDLDELLQLDYAGASSSGPSGQPFYHVQLITDKRDVKDENIDSRYNSIAVPEIIVDKKVFKNVYVSEGLGVIFSFEKGIAAFRDIDGNMWTLKE